MQFSVPAFLRKLSLLMIVFGSVVARAELTIRPSDIKDGHYIYQLEQSDMRTLTPESGKLPNWDWTPTGNKFFDDVHSFSNLRMTGSRWAFVQMKPGARSAEFVYKFDFSKTGRRPTSLRLREVVRHEQDGATYDKRATTSFASFLRIGETGEWMPLDSSEPGKGYIGDKVELTPVIVIKGGATVVYYKVTFTSDQPIRGEYLKKGDPAGNEGRGGPLWNLTRADHPDNFFQVVFQTEAANGR